MMALFTTNKRLTYKVHFSMSRKNVETKKKISNAMLCKKLRKFTLTHFWQKFRESNIVSKETTKYFI